MAERFIIVRDWMIGELGLSGFDLLIYALIQGYSQANAGSYHGSFEETAGWVGCTRRTAISSLRHLSEIGLIESVNYTDENGWKRVAYTANERGSEKISPVKKFHQTSEKISPETSEIFSKPPYINSISKDINNTNPNACAREEEDDKVEGKQRHRSTELIPIEQRIENAQRELREGVARYADLYPKEMLDDFAAYWGEPFLNISRLSARVVRWQGEKTWDLAGRLRTWARRASEYNHISRPAYQRTPLRPVCETDGRTLDEICAAAEAQEKADKEAGYYD